MPRTITIRGFKGKLTKATAKGKKWKFTYTYTGKKRSVSAGAKGYSISPGTKRGNNYCARSYGIKRKKGGGVTPNDVSRFMWRCRKGKSLRR